MIKLKDIIKEGVIEPLLEEETYNLKSKKTQDCHIYKQRQL